MYSICQKILFKKLNKPFKLFRPKNESEREQYKEHRRVCHITAEQKRRHNIKNNFDVLQSLLPSISHNPNAKVTKNELLFFIWYSFRNFISFKTSILLSTIQFYH